MSERACCALGTCRLCCATEYQRGLGGAYIRNHLREVAERWGLKDYAPGWW